MKLEPGPGPEPGPGRGPGAERRQLLCAAGLLAAWPAAIALQPRRRTADVRGAIDLAQQVPTSFGAWRPDPSLRPVLPDPAAQAAIDLVYTQTLARTYAGPRGARVMLSIAYGNDQASEATAVHRPEFCYRTQGFSVTDLGVHQMALGASGLAVQRLQARLGGHIEPITYWITLDETATLPGLGRKWQQMRHGLAGWIADGMVVRISTLGVAEAAAFAVHDRFAADLLVALPAPMRPRYFGRGALA